MSENVTSNIVKLRGVVEKELEYSHEIFGEKFYTLYMRVDRLSGTTDLLPVAIPRRIINPEKTYKGKNMEVHGQLRTYNCHDGAKDRLIISVSAKEIKFFEHEEENETGRNNNSVRLEGYLCKEPTYRITPLGREISDILLAVNRSYGKTDYIPCITWGVDARRTSYMGIGTRVAITGRMQSREYVKHLEDEVAEIRTAYEISVKEIEVMEEKE